MFHADVRAAFPGHSVSTVTEAGWRGSNDGSLLGLAERRFDVFVTIDRKFEHQFDLHEFALGFIIVRVTSNTLAAYVPGFERLRRAAEIVRKARSSNSTRARAVSGCFRLRSVTP